MKRLLAMLLAVMVVMGTLSVVFVSAEAPQGVYGTDYVKYGDINLDEAVNAGDALEALKYAVGKTALNEVQQVVADVNVSGKIDAGDALDILKLAVGKLACFDAGEYYIINEFNPEPDEDFIANYDKSNSVNGAYELDTTADTSFSVNIDGLAKNSIYRLSATVLSGDYGVDGQRLICSLQGLINRDFGMDEDHTVLVYVLSDTADSGWLNYIESEGSIMEAAGTTDTVAGMTEVRLQYWDNYYAAFKDIIKECGIILWDGNVPATANVAATICGLDGYLPVLADSPLHEFLVSEGVPVKMSLVGMFENGKKGQNIVGTTIASTGSAKNDAYLWALEKYFNRCSSQYLAYTLDGAVTIADSGFYTGNNCLNNHDYLIARRCFFFDLAPYKAEAACDDPAQKNGQASIGVDNETMLKIFQARYDRANGEFGQLMGFPPWWAKYTTHNNQGSKAATWIEWLYCEYITCYNLAKEADAQSPSSMSNGSVYYKYVPSQTQYTNNKQTEDITYDSSTYYYTIYIGDYDSSAWLKQHIYNMWYNRGGDRYRGRVYMMWSINPNLSYRVPMIFDYMYANLSSKDYMAGGDGGAGYIIPEALFHDNTLPYMGEKRPANNTAAGAQWAAYSKTFYDRFDMDITGFIINGASTTLSANIAQMYSTLSPVGNLTNCSSTLLAKYNGTPFVYCQNGIGKAGDSTSSTMYTHQFNRMSGYNFSAYRTVCHTPSEIYATTTAYETYADGKGKTVKYCDPYTFFDLLQQSGQGTVMK